MRLKIKRWNNQMNKTLQNITILITEHEWYYNEYIMWYITLCDMNRNSYH